MYLHLGQDYIVPLQNVVAVFDMDTATVSGRTQRLLSRLQASLSCTMICRARPCCVKVRSARRCI